MSAIACIEFYKLLSPEEQQKFDSMKLDLQQEKLKAKDALSRFDHFTENVDNMKAYLLEYEESRKMKKRSTQKETKSR
jgi:hypothetical protein